MSNNRVVGGGVVPGEGMLGKLESLSSISIVQQQHRSNEFRTRQPIKIEGRSSHAAETEAAVAAVGRRSTALAKRAERPQGGKTSRDLPPTYPDRFTRRRAKAGGGAGEARGGREGKGD